MEIKKIIIGCVLTLTTSMAIASPNENEFTLESRFYAKNYGVSEQEALRRLALQKSSYIKIDRLKKHFASLRYSPMSRPNYHKIKIELG